MRLKVRYKASARADVRQAVLWYEAQATGLGAEFLRSVALVEAQLTREPALYAAVHGHVRRAVLRKFPYALFFVIEPELVAVLGCFHHRRDPTRWPGR